MDITRLFRRDLTELLPYEAVASPEAMAEVAGIPPNKIIRLNANENPYGPSPRLQEALGQYRSYHVYPDAQQKALRKALEQYTGISSDYILLGAGCDELIDLVLRATLEPRDRVINCPPTFGMYPFSTQVNGGTLVSIPRDTDFQVDLPAVKKAIDDRTKVIFLTSPNNPTGNLAPDDVVLSLLEHDILVVVDETYFEFCGHTVAPLVSQHPNLVVLRTLSKWAGLAGLRVGYGIMAPRLLRLLMDIKQPYNINAAAEVALLVSLKDVAYLMHNVKALVQERERLFARLSLIPGIVPRPSQGNFLLCHVSGGRAIPIFQGLARRGIFVRYFDTSRLRDTLRITVGKPEHTDALLAALEEIFKEL
ncbi:MAG: histidinol-phosphate transaminase [Chloroflexi bacterium]|nr:histidinol-phosphate transaminase [Chloroflexota bacterium]